MDADLTITILTYVAVLVVSAVVLYFVVRAAVLSALRTHALWHADGSFQVELERHRRRASD